MKNYLAVIFVMVSLMSLSVASAETFKFPKGAPSVSISFPDGWDVGPDPDGADGVAATSKDEEVVINFWHVDKNEVKGGDLTKMTSDEVIDIIKSQVSDFKVTSQDNSNHNGLTTASFSGTGKDRESHNDALVRTMFLTPDDKNLFVLLYWGSESAEKANLKELNQIMDSLKKL